MVVSFLCIEASHLTFPRIGSASVGIIVRNLATGKDEVVENADKLMTPASILKCVTAAATLMNNGSDKSFLTETVVDGSCDSDGVLHGNIVVKGVADPTLCSDNFPDYSGLADSIASHLRMSGITGIAGKLSLIHLICKNPARGVDGSIPIYVIVMAPDYMRLISAIMPIETWRCVILRVNSSLMLKRLLIPWGFICCQTLVKWAVLLSHRYMSMRHRFMERLWM